MQRSRRAGFTLFEIVLAMAVIVVIVSITYPSLEAMLRQSRITAGADAFRAGLMNARAQAVEEGTAYRVGIIPGTGNFRVAPDGDAYWKPGAMPQQDDGRQAYIYEEHMPNGVVFSDTGSPITVQKDGETFNEPEKVSPADYKSVAVYLPDGTARQDYQALLCGRGGTPLWVILRSLTGEVSVVRSQEGR
jgi:prepilin-type N-terminal cleavage/methylation domain-containing protein